MISAPSRVRWVLCSGFWRSFSAKLKACGTWRILAGHEGRDHLLLRTRVAWEPLGLDGSDALTDALAFAQRVRCADGGVIIGADPRLRTVGLVDQPRRRCRSLRCANEVGDQGSRCDPMCLGRLTLSRRRSPNGGDGAVNYGADRHACERRGSLASYGDGAARSDAQAGLGLKGAVVPRCSPSG